MPNAVGTGHSLPSPPHPQTYGPQVRATGLDQGFPFLLTVCIAFDAQVVPEFTSRSFLKVAPMSPGCVPCLTVVIPGCSAGSIPV